MRCWPRARGGPRVRVSFVKISNESGPPSPEVGGDRAGDGSPGGCARAWGWLREWGGRGVCVRVSVRCVWVAFVCCCFACDCVPVLVCRVRFARVSCPWLRFESPHHGCEPVQINFEDFFDESEPSTARPSEAPDGRMGAVSRRRKRGTDDSSALPAEKRVTRLQCARLLSG